MNQTYGSQRAYSLGNAQCFLNYSASVDSFLSSITSWVLKSAIDVL